MILILAFVLSLGFFGFELYEYIKTRKEIDRFINGAIQKRVDMNYAANKYGVNIDELLKDLES